VLGVFGGCGAINAYGNRVFFFHMFNYNNMLQIYNRDYTRFIYLTNIYNIERNVSNTVSSEE
jgi:hypothetical protein